MGSTEDFLRLLNEDAIRVAAQQTPEGVGVDQYQLQRDQERREKWGQLRARPHPGSRPYEVRSVFGHTNMNGGDSKP